MNMHFKIAILSSCLVIGIQTSIQAIEVPQVLKVSQENEILPFVPTVKLLVLHDQLTVHLEVNGRYKIIDPYTGKHLSTRFLGKDKCLQPLADGLKWGEEFPGYYQLQLIPVDETTQFFVNGVEYKGSISIYNLGQTLSLINEIAIEEYVSSMLENYVLKNYSSEVLAALAISERTNAYYQSQYPKTKFWAVDGNLYNYKGNRPISEAVKKAVRDTKYMILSKTTPYEGVITPFQLKWKEQEAKSLTVQNSKISLADAEKLVQKEEHAAKILSQAFPEATIQIVRFNQSSRS